MISNKREDGGLPWGRADYLNMYRIAERLGMPNEKLRLLASHWKRSMTRRLTWIKSCASDLGRREKQEGRQG